MNPFKLLDPSYLFDATPGETFMYFWPLLILFIAIIIASFQVRKAISRHRNPKVAYKLLGSIPTIMREFAVIGLLLTFLRNEDIPWLGMRAWLIVLFLLMAVYGIWKYKSYHKNYLKLLRKEKVQIVEDQYMPTCKKKRKKKKR
jgi:phosphatidylglycerophosphate synthase